VPEAERKQKILQASFGDLQEAVGEKLQPVLIGLTDAGQGVLDWLDANPKVAEGASAAFDLMGQALSGVWEILRKYLLPGLGWLVGTQAKVIEGTAGMVDALNQIPGLGDLIPDDAGDKLRSMADGVQAVADGLQAWGNDPPPKVDIDDSKAQAKAKAIDNKISKLNKQKVKLRSEGDTKGADKIENRIRALQKQKHQVKVGVGFVRNGKQTVRITRGVGGGTMRISMNASGHPSTPSATMTILGDGGEPEAVILPTGSQVLSGAQTRAARSQGRLGGGAGGDVFIQQISVKGDTNPNAAARRIQKAAVQTRAAYGPGYRQVRSRG
jgi:hypothetical protein